jgi:uncharacterized protein (TIGR00369 family)
MANKEPALPFDASLDGLSQLKAWIAAGRRPPMGETVDIWLTEVSEGRAVFEGTPSERIYNPTGVAHGGYAATILDSAVGCAVHSRMAPGQRYTTLELKVAFHKPITIETGPIRAEGWAVSVGSRAAFAEGKITDRNGTLLASATSTLLVMSR